MSKLTYRHVDVFARGPLTGNGLTVLVTDEMLDARLMQQITCELRQYETIFLVPRETRGEYDARIFTMEEELPFAGHPLLGAAAVIHETNEEQNLHCRLHVAAGSVELHTVRTDYGFAVTMDQGAPEFGAVISPDEEKNWLPSFGLAEVDRDGRLPMSVVSTGLPYLIIPVTGFGLARAKPQDLAIRAKLDAIGAKFVYLLDVSAIEGRTWDNAGGTEDIATGSAAGPVGAFLVRHGLASAGALIRLRQGRFLNRPSEILINVAGSPMNNVLVSGHVSMIARGQFDASIVHLANE